MAAASHSASQEILEVDKKAFEDLVNKPYVEQSKWLLNAFWNDPEPGFATNEQAREDVYHRTQLFVELDKEKGKNGCSLDEVGAHRFLEKLGETLTILALREQLRKIDLNFDGRMAPSEYFLFLYKKEVTRLVRPQADPVEVQNAAQMVATAQASVADMSEKLRVQAEALAELQAAEAEARAAVDELKKQEDEYAAKIETLTAKSSDPNLGTVSRGKAAAELGQLKAEDPLPLRRAKITQEASLRRVEKARAKAEESKKHAEDAVAVAEKQLADAEAYLADVSSRVGSTEGSVWYMQREIKEAQKYLPRAQKSVKPIA